MTLDDRLRGALRDPEVTVPPPGFVDRVVAALPERHQARPWRIVAGLVAAVLVVALAGAALSGAWVGPASTSSATPPSTVAGATATTPAPASPTAGLSATDDGLTLQVTVNQASVAPGGQITVQVAVHNGRSTPVAYRGPQCGPSPAAVMMLRVPLPLDPPGETWTGLRGQFKSYALTTGYGAGGVPAISPVDIQVPGGSCGGYSSAQLAPGQTIDGSLTWTADIVPGVPALPGDVPFTVTVDHDPVAPPTPAPLPTSTGLHLPGFQVGPMYHTLTVSGHLRVSGPAPKEITAGQALDAILRDGRFATWLAQQPSSSWSNANLFLEYIEQQGQTIIPAGSSWEVDLFREPRNWAIGFVDPLNGGLRSVTFCNIPCSR